MHQIQVKPTAFKVVTTKLTTWRTIQRKYSVTDNCFSLMSRVIKLLKENGGGGGKLKINKKPNYVSLLSSCQLE